jgi:hypothetical protein
MQLRRIDIHRRYGQASPEDWPIRQLRFVFKPTPTLVTAAAGGLGSHRSDVHWRRSS